MKKKLLMKLKKIFSSDNKKELLVLFLFLIFSILLSNLWFSNSQYISGGDFFINPNGIKELNKLIFIWDENNLGSIDGLSHNKYFLILFDTIMIKLFGLILGSHMHFSIIIFLVCFSFFIFSKIITENILIRILGVLFYISNPMLFYANYLTDAIIFSYICMPLIFYFVFKYFYLNHKLYYYSYILSLFLLLPVFSNPPMVIITFLPTIIFLCFNYKLIIRSGFQKSLKLLIPLILILSFAFFPLFIKFSNQTNFSDDINLNWMVAKSKESKIINVFIFQAKWSIKEGVIIDKNKPLSQDNFELYYPFLKPYYSNSFLIFFQFLLLISLFSGLLFKSKDKMNLLSTFLLTLLFSIFLSKGIQKPFGNIIIYFFKYIPFFDIFREPFSKFGFLIAFSYSFLIIFFLSNLNKKELLNKSHINFFSYISLFVLILVIGFPFFNGQIIPKERLVLKGFSFNPPAYWYHQPELNISGNVFLLPKNPRNYVHYFWDYFGADRADFIFNYPTINYNEGYFVSINDVYINSFYDKFTYNFSCNDTKYYISKFFEMNIDYIVHRNDLNWNDLNNNSITKTDSPSDIKYKLSCIPNITYISNFSYLDYYKFDYNPKTLNNNYFKKKNNVYLTSSMKINNLEVIKKNPVKYVIKNISDINQIGLFTSYHPNWVIYFDKIGEETNVFESFYRHSYNDNNHIILFNYTNGWNINNSLICTELYNNDNSDGDKCFYNVTIFFKPQSYFYLFELFLLFLLIYTLFNLFIIHIIRLFN